jgi:hypothetical protein
MLTLDYELSPSWKMVSDQTDLANADEMDLRYSVLLGDVVFKEGSHDFSARWGWVPIVDFAASLRGIAAGLDERDCAEATFEFTESDATLSFRRKGEAILITSSYSLGEARVPLRDLVAAVDAFAGRVARELSQRYSSLARNASFSRLFSGALDRHNQDAGGE